MSPLRATIRTVAEIDAIAAISDPIIRNLRITHCYHELSTALAGRLDSGVNWCTFATWASKQAGQTIRGEDMMQALENLPHGESKTVKALRDVAEVAALMGSRLGAAEAYERIRREIFSISSLKRASDAVARGNKKVFEEIGREFARFYSICLSDESHTSEKIDEFCNGLRAGDPPDGQTYLRRAFRRYYQTLFETDPKKRAETILLANIEIGYHEQTRLQPEIKEALDAAMADSAGIRKRVMQILFPPQGTLGKVWRSVSRLFGKRTPFNETILHNAIDLLIEAARKEIRILLTDHMMTLTLPPGTRLRLGADLSAQFPVSLRELSDADLLTLLGSVDPTPNSVIDSAARDWANLPDRLHFIVDMFRCYQESRDLFSPPFSEEQVVVLMAGKVPARPL